MLPFLRPTVIHLQKIAGCIPLLVNNSLITSYFFLVTMLFYELMHTYKRINYGYTVLYSTVLVMLKTFKNVKLETEKMEICSFQTKRQYCWYYIILMDICIHVWVKIVMWMSRESNWICGFIPMERFYHWNRLNFCIRASKSVTSISISSLRARNKNSCTTAPNLIYTYCIAAAPVPRPQP